MSRKKLDKIKLKNIYVLLFCLTICFIHFNNTPFFNLGNYFVLPSITIFFGLILVGPKFIKTIISGEENEKRTFLISIIPLLLLLPNLFRGFDFDMFAATVLCYLFVSIAYLNDYSHQERKLIEYSYIFYGLILAFRIIILARQPYLEIGDKRYGAFFNNHEFYNVNVTALLLTGSLAISLKNILYDKSFISRILNIAVLILISVSIVMTGSRAGFLTMITMIITTFFLYFRKEKIRPFFSLEKKLLIFVFSLMIIVLVLSLKLIDNEVIERLFLRSYLTTNSLRFKKWGYGIDLIKLKPLLGHGIYNPGNLYNKIFGNSVSVHSTFLVIFVDYGLIGLLFYLIYYVSPLIKLIQDKNVFLTTYYIMVLFFISLIETQSSLALMTILSLFAINLKGEMMK